MGLVVMSKRELNRRNVLARLDSDRLTARAADDGDATASVSAVEKILRWRRLTVAKHQRLGRSSNNRMWFAIT
jgi:hypothetical protein